MLLLMTRVIGSFVSSAFFLVYLTPFISIMALIGIITLLWSIIKLR